MSWAYSHLQTISEPTLGLLGGSGGRQTETSKQKNPNQEVVICSLKTEKGFFETVQPKKTVQGSPPCFTGNTLNEENGSAHVCWINFRSNYVTDPFYVRFYIINNTQCLVQPLMISNQIKS